MICPNCGKQFPENAKFCNVCGVKLVEHVPHPESTQSKANQNAYSAAQPGANSKNAYTAPSSSIPNNPKPKKSSGTTAIALSIAGILTLVLVVGVIYAYQAKLGPFAKNETVAEDQNNSQESNDTLTLSDSTEEDDAASSTASAKDAKATGKATVSATVEDVATDFDENSVRAEETYNEQVVTLKGYINQISTDEDGRYVVTLSENDGSYHAYDINCYCNEKDRVLSIKQGQYVAATGLLQTDDDSFFLSDCTYKAAKIKKKASDSKASDSKHRYQIFVADVNWQQAFDDCKARGGYLVQVDDADEFATITKQIEAEGQQDVHFYLGGRRDKDEYNYYWVNTDDEPIGRTLNPEYGGWASDYWMANEPSYTSDDGDEMYMNLIYYQNNWVLNDVPLDITKYYKGKTGYICEFDS